MITCSNCDNEAQFQYNIAVNNSLAYCGVHLPKFLRGKSAASLLVSKIEPPAPATKKKSTKPAPEPVIEDVVEEVVEDVVEEETPSEE